MPPLKREQLTDLRRERIFISEDLFNLKPVPNHKSNHCWTPLHDLSTSDDDDGINSGNHSDESLQKSDKELNGNGYDTRFTLKNQLRTIVQNKQNKQNHNIFPYWLVASLVTSVSDQLKPLEARKVMLTYVWPNWSYTSPSILLRIDYS